MDFTSEMENALTSQEHSIDSFTSEDVFGQIRDRMETRRQLVAEQTKADLTKSILCDRIYEQKQHLGVQSQISELEHTAPQLYKYIKYLETVQYGVWCGTCNKTKSCDVAREADDTLASDKVQELLDYMVGMDMRLRNEQSLMEEHIQRLHCLSDSLKMVQQQVRELGLSPADGIIPATSWSSESAWAPESKWVPVNSPAGKKKCSAEDLLA